MNSLWRTICFIVVCLCAIEGKIIANKSGNNRIFNGQDAQIEEFPYQVHINGPFSCGGSIIASNVIVTAAHCTNTISPGQIEIRAGSANRYQGGVTRKVTRIIQHLQYIKKASGEVVEKMDYDISLLILSENLPYSNTIQPIPLANENENVPDGSFMTVTGWGLTYAGRAFPSILQKIQLPFVNQNKCLSYPSTMEPTPRMFCAGFYQANAGTTCSGDSGGPAVFNGKLFGIVSAGITDCKGGASMSYFTSVPVLRQWIHEQINL